MLVVFLLVTEALQSCDLPLPLAPPAFEPDVPFVPDAAPLEPALPSFAPPLAPDAPPLVPDAPPLAPEAPPLPSELEPLEPEPEEPLELWAIAEVAMASDNAATAKIFEKFTFIGSLPVVLSTDKQPVDS